MQRGRQTLSKPLHDSSPPNVDNGDDEPTFKVTKLSSETVVLPSAPPPPPVLRSSPATQHIPSQAPLPQKSDSSEGVEGEGKNQSTYDSSLQALYPWTYMSSMLDACFTDSETPPPLTATTSTSTTPNDLKNDASEKTLAEPDENKEGEDDEFLNRPERLEPEQLVEFCAELGSDEFAKEAPAIMRKFHKHGESCSLIETDALKLASGDRPPADDSDDDPLKAYNDILEDLERLLSDAHELQESITRLTSVSANEGVSAAPTPATSTGVDPSSSTSPTSTSTVQTEGEVQSAEAMALATAKSAVFGVFNACLPILKARISNLTIAQELVDSALENASLSLRMESMGL